MGLTLMVSIGMNVATPTRCSRMYWMHSLAVFSSSTTIASMLVIVMVDILPICEKEKRKIEALLLSKDNCDSNFVLVLNGSAEIKNSSVNTVRVKLFEAF